MKVNNKERTDISEASNDNIQLSDKEQLNNKIKLAEKIIAAAQDKIVANMRFMDSAVFALKNVPDARSMMTDGNAVHYSCEDIFERTSSGLSNFTHDYMHVLLHCVFKHYFIKGKVNKLFWNLATDIAVEELIQSLLISCFDSIESSERREELRKLRLKRGRLSADKLYKSFVSDPPIGSEISNLQDLFTIDDHSLWYDEPLKKYRMSESEKTSDDQESHENGNSDFDGDEDEFELQDIEEAKDDDSMSEGASLLSDQDWDKIREMMKTALEMDDLSFGDSGGKILKELQQAEKKPVDYSTFLRKFATMHENMKVDDDSYDYIMYTYGLERYKDMPLIEPLEYKDEKSIKDLIIAIDTSGSTDGELVKKFISKSFEILGNKTVLGSSFNIHVIQCDAEIQDDTVLKNRDDVENFINNMEIKGLGGTDFRPVFRYIDELTRNKEIRDLRGLLYFTDGKGTYPKRKPPYDTAFIFVDDDAYDDEVPAWAMKVYFNEDSM